MTDEVESLRIRLTEAAAAAGDLAELDAVRVEALGKQGAITRLLKALGSLSPEERVAVAPRYQALRQDVATAIEARRTALADAALDARLAVEWMDMSLPPPRTATGSIHPVSQVMDELAEIFADLGFAVAEGPEIEDDWHNFTALNIPPEHPARAMHDTFYVKGANASRDGDAGRLLLRTHTSPVQIRTMTSAPPPVRIIAPGRVYRSDSDATHTPMFHQVEGLVIDRDIHMGHLRWTLETFLKAFFGLEELVLRFRPSYFPFTEPSVEVDVGCSWAGDRLTIGGSASWLEVLGAGMVHRKVLENCGLSAAEWQGFAFGCGIDRLAMLKYGMTDLRAFFDADLRWLRHHGFRALDVPTISGSLA
ncbi:MAG: phenylalanine--tRNA ligase subunit alpha [Thermaurantiacus sp.]